ncbi:ABC transporter permease [Thaumasiovibrio subtropicus]|uniref:ABC transporter permease n=1 Tax=Thaumasiovibrio subtropicus TaxID=1891207 RepID=UPI000B34EEA6|nr:iron ABC transporter permease [Thaumasiovibrio subtropicus]
MTEKFLFWRTSSWGLSLLLVLPILAIVYTAIGDADEIFAHLMSTVLGTYAWNTLSVVAFTLLLAIIFGVPSAWLMVMCRVPGAKVLQWALVLPLAMPSYIVAYIYTDWFDYAGPVQIWLRNLFGWQTIHDYYFPDIRSIGGAALIMALVLFPYVYLLARGAFMEQSASLLNSARLLKCSPLESFRRLSLPLARPSIAVGASLVAMETVGDFGTMSYFAVPTLTTAVYDTWLGYSSLTAAAKLSAVMLLVIFLLLSAERYSRRKLKLFHQEVSAQPEPYPLSGWRKWAAAAWCWGLIGAAFLFPVFQLLYYAVNYFAESWTPEFRQYSINSLSVSFWAALIACFIAIAVNFNRRLVNKSSAVVPLRIASMGYAVPGTVLAIGVMIILVSTDHLINGFVRSLDYRPPGLLLSGTMFALIVAFVVRFSAVAIGSVESSLAKIPPSMDMAARTMGCNATAMLRRVHFPLIRRGILIAGLLVFIESMKELNAALLLRPFNFETLATYVFNFASDEQLEHAALPAILLVLVGLIPLIVVNRSLEQKS